MLFVPYIVALLHQKCPPLGSSLYPLFPALSILALPVVWVEIEHAVGIPIISGFSWFPFFLLTVVLALYAASIHVCARAGDDHTHSWIMSMVPVAAICYWLEYWVEWAFGDLCVSQSMNDNKFGRSLFAAMVAIFAWLVSKIYATERRGTVRPVGPRGMWETFETRIAPGCYYPHLFPGAIVTGTVVVALEASRTCVGHRWLGLRVVSQDDVHFLSAVVGVFLVAGQWWWDRLGHQCSFFIRRRNPGY